VRSGSQFSSKKKKPGNALDFLTPNLRWLIAFSLWLLFLSGSLAGFLGTPGILQSLRLRNLLAAKKHQHLQLQEELRKLQTESSLLEKNRYAQEREVRKVLGYVAGDELIFDFTAAGL
jgi:cell division protein FtsB